MYLYFLVLTALHGKVVNVPSDMVGVNGLPEKPKPTSTASGLED